MKSLTPQNALRFAVLAVLTTSVFLAVFFNPPFEFVAPSQQSLSVSTYSWSSVEPRQTDASIWHDGELGEVSWATPLELSLARNEPNQALFNTLVANQPPSSDDPKFQIWLNDLKAYAQNQVPLRSPWFGSIHSDLENIIQLDEGAIVWLHAYAISIPDTEQLIYYEGATMPGCRELQAKQLKDCNLPELFLGNSSETRSDSPTLVLLLRKYKMPDFILRNHAVFDVRTSMRIDEGEKMLDVIGEWIRIEIPLDIWHDTRIAVALDLVTGRRIEGELPLQKDARLKLGQSEELLVERVVIYPESKKIAPVWIRRLGPPGLSGYIYKNHLRFFYGNSEVLLGDDIEPDPERKTHLFEGDHLQVFAFPHMTRVWLNIHFLPEMPNSRDIENLFDVRIPKVVATGHSFPPQLLPDDHIISQICNATELKIYRAPDWKFPKETTKTFVDTTPRELLQYYLKNAGRGARATVDLESRTLHIRSETTKTDPIEIWLSKLKKKLTD